MNYKELMEFALINYEKGGDFIYECWDERTFNDYVAEFGDISKSKALEIFKQLDERRQEIQSTIW
jgi:hypothetical protein